MQCGRIGTATAPSAAGMHVHTSRAWWFCAEACCADGSWCFSLPQADALQDFGGAANAITVDGLRGPAIIGRMIERQYTVALLPGYKAVPGFGVIAGVKNSSAAAAVTPSRGSLSVIALNPPPPSPPRSRPPHTSPSNLGIQELLLLLLLHPHW